ncbi:MAG: MBL fold metallo-hydrolase [Cycloclasticus sp. symbiont of Bathymodiolus heckerae]|nr:MAG: MBL fold metallo-hydrolase [Cycloclasticus sp. symbiont of Bathymodiolus heckerae]
MTNFQKITLFFCAGILSVQLLTSLPTIANMFFIFCFALAVFKWARSLSCFLLGFVWVATYAMSIESHQLPEILEGEEVLVVGEVVNLPVQDVRSTRFLLRVGTVESSDHDITFPSIIKLSWYGRGHELKSGERWRLKVKLKRRHGLVNPHGFDYEKWLFQQKIGATGYVRKSEDNKRLEASDKVSVSYWREHLRSYLNVGLAGSQHLGVVKALVLGDRSGINDKQWEVFRQTGTSHLIAISGLHIGLISALVFGLVRWLSLRCLPIRHKAGQCALVISLIAAFLYAALAGFSVPTQRALIMLSVVLAAAFWRRHYTPFHVISVALFGVLLIDPLAPLSAGFWLSFAAVAVILYGVVGRLSRAGAVRQLMAIQWWVAIGLMPLVLLFFGQVSLIAPLANMLAVPLVSFLIVPLLFAALLLSMLSETLSVVVLRLANKLIDYMWQFLEMLSGIELSSLSLSGVSVLACFIAVVGVVFLLLPKGFIPKPLACLLFIPLLFPMKVGKLSDGEFKLVLLDVGQGLSAVIHTSNHTLVFDTGAKYSEKSDLASTVVMPYLNGEGITQIDTLLISHGDNDHAGGANTLLASFKVNSLMTSVSAMFAKHKPIECKYGVAWVWDGVEFEILSPSQFNLFEGNNASCVLRVSSINGSVLLPGDIEKSMESSLLQYKASSLKADILIAPHHGSKTSSTSAFIGAVSPRYVLFPVGYKNRFKFPSKLIVERYSKRGIQSYDTASGGALTVDFLKDKQLSIDSYRQTHPKFWSWK